jgi:hypothetical protein
MIAMKVTDENVVDPMEVCLKFHELHLGAFSAINKEMAVLNFQQLR